MALLVASLWLEMNTIIMDIFVELVCSNSLLWLGMNTTDIYLLNVYAVNSLLWLGMKTIIMNISC